MNNSYNLLEMEPGTAVRFLASSPGLVSAVSRANEQTKGRPFFSYREMVGNREYRVVVRKLFAKKEIDLDNLSLEELQTLLRAVDQKLTARARADARLARTPSTPLGKV